MKKGRKKGIIIAIIVLVAIILILLAAAFLLSEMKKSESVAFNFGTNTIYSFYSEKRNSLDGVYIGSSAAYRYWAPARAFEDEGICIYNLGSTTQPFVATKNIIKETLKTQPDMDVIIIELRGSVRNTDKTSEERIEQLTDAIPFSINRKEMIDRTLEFFETAGADLDYTRSNYYFPMSREDGAWLDNYRFEMLRVLYIDRYRQTDKGLYMSFDCSALNGPIEYTESEPIEKVKEDMVDDLLAYCKTLDQEVVFVSAPYESNYGWEGELKYVVNKCEKAGFETLDFNCEPLQSELTLDWNTDFIDFKHANTFGAVKYTDYLTNYLSKKYDFEDHREEEGYESWHKAVKHLNEEIEENQ